MKKASNALRGRHAEGHKLRGNAAFHQKAYDQAVAEYTAGLAAAGGDAGAKAVLHSNRAAALQAQGRLLDALADCAAARALDPGYTRALQRRADAHMELGDYAAAVADLEELSLEGSVPEPAVAAKLEEARRKARAFLARFL